MSDTQFIVETMQVSDWEQVRKIYLEGMATENATFETNAPGWDAWNAAHLPFGRFVARADHSVIGWAALSPVSSRCLYAGVAEVSIYVGAAARDPCSGVEDPKRRRTRTH